MDRPARSPVGVAGRAVRGAARALGARRGLLGWATVAPLAGLAGARVVGYEGTPTVAVANAATPFAYLPAWAVLAGAVRGRRPALALTAAAVAGAHLAWTAPELRGRRSLPPAAAGGPRLRVFSANIRFTAPDWVEVAADIAASGADLVLIQELTAANLAVLRREGAFAGYTDELVDARPRSFGSGIWSRYPLEEAEVRDLAGLPMSRARVKVDGCSLQVWNVHTRSPLVGGLDRWHAQLRLLADEAAAAIAGGDPLVVAGDFNATYGNRDFRAILRRGLRDAHVEVGRGLATTWTAWAALPRLFRVDHVLVSEDVAVVDVRESPARESDHQGVVADLALLPRPGLASPG